jgi:hypothetical protein
MTDLSHITVQAQVFSMVSPALAPLRQKTGASVQVRGLNFDSRLTCSHNFLSASVLTDNVSAS